MQKMQEVYDMLWRALIQPERLQYSVDDLSPENYQNRFGELFRRLDFAIRNRIGQKIALSVWVPADVNVTSL